jgi:tetratricopeptide (TPR) repeat protein
MRRHVVFACFVLLCSSHIVAAQSPPEEKAVSSTAAASSSASGVSSIPSGATSPANSSPPSPLSEALRLYRKGEFEGAIHQYQQLLQEKPKSPDAYAGLARVYLKRKDIQQAHETISKGMDTVDSPTVKVALGEVLFREGKIPEAEEQWVKVVNSGYPMARAYLGLARVREAISMYASAKRMIDKARELDPNDPDIQKAWIDTLGRKERITYLESYLASENNDDAETRASARFYLEYLKARQREPKRVCRLVSNVTSTETGLVRLLLDPTHLRGYGLTVQLNNRKTNLLLDTGAGGILVDRGIAEKAGITKLSETRVGGIGDKGTNPGWIGLASSIRVGNLEFRDCPVDVLEKRSVVGEDGLIGADVFSDFLVDIDFPNEKLRLKELPKRPDEAPRVPELKTDTTDSDSPEDPPTTEHQPPEAKTAKAPSHSGPFDRYLAPEMKSYTQAFRFGHDLLIPTKIGDVPNKLFLLDTGAFTNQITPSAAREVTKVRGDDMIVKGLSGSVKKVYSADKAILQFGHLRQENQDLLSFDLSGVSDHAGTEVSGTLGFVMLHLLDLKIDYRDGLVDFDYKPR